jgi:hypothetical protein
MDEIRLALFLKQTNGLRDALYSENKKDIAAAIKKMKFTKTEYAELPDDLMLYHQGIRDCKINCAI